MIAVTDTANGQPLGYISRHSFGHAQYRYQSSEAEALVVSFKVTNANVNNVRITCEVSAPLLGLAQPRLNRQ